MKESGKQVLSTYGNSFKIIRTLFCLLHNFLMKVMMLLYSLDGYNVK